MRLKDRRQALGLSQSQLAERAGVSIRMIQYYEQGANDINKAEAYTLWKIAKALECNMEDLIEWKYINPDVHKIEEGCK